jgi:hypothetical protein
MSLEQRSEKRPGSGSKVRVLALSQAPKVELASEQPAYFAGTKSRSGKRFLGAGARLCVILQAE